jgi:protein TonB
MALHDLTLQSVEHYGGIDLKNNYKKYFSSSLGISIALHCIVIFFYVAWNWFSQEDEAKIPRIRVHSLTELQAPPSLNEQQDIPLNAAPPPSADVVKPNFGVPVPVPDAVAPTVDFQDLNKIQPQGVVGGSGTVAGVVGGTGDQPVHLEVKAVEKDPEPDEFISVEQDPTPVQPLQSLVRYPDVAQRSGIEGTVQLRALIGKDGTVEKVMVDKSSGYSYLDDAAKDALMRAKFTPARQNGQPVKVWFEAPIKFKLNH